MADSRYITSDDRIRIETMYNSLKFPPKLIADTLGFHFTSIYRELKRGYCEMMDTELRPYAAYSACIAQADYDAKASRKGCDLKIGNDHALAQYIEDKIRQKFSPMAALYAIENEGRSFKTKISHTTLYRYIDMGLFLTITNKDLPSGKRKRCYKRVRRLAYKNSLRPSIAQRPAEVKSRSEFGHWEMDTVEGKAKGKSTCLLVLSERKTRGEIVVKLKQKTTTNVVAALDKLHRCYGQHFSRIFKTITVDNGTEFDDYRGMSKGDRTQIYYCHPNCSWERGTNENQNRLIRRHIPKGTRISKYSVADIEYIQNWMNDYPRGIFNGKSSNMMLKDELASILGDDLSSFLATKA